MMRKKAVMPAMERKSIAEFETYQYSKDDWAPNDYWNNHYTMINCSQ